MSKEIANFLQMLEASLQALIKSVKIMQNIVFNLPVDNSEKLCTSKKIGFTDDIVDNFTNLSTSTKALNKEKERKERKVTKERKERIKKQYIYNTRDLVICNKDKETNIYINVFAELWKLYPNKDGRKAAFNHFRTTVCDEKSVELIKKALQNYLNSRRVKDGYIKNGSTWFNNWQDWVDYTELEESGNENSKKYKDLPVVR